MSHYNNHMFICTNNKENSKECCQTHQASEMLLYAKQQAALLGLNKASGFRVSGSGCMGRCADGPVLVIYPQAAWYKYSSKADIDQILNLILSGQNLPGNI